jgi:monofunctional biosynthetic peptidoglycan transglycosylase
MKKILKWVLVKIPVAFILLSLTWVLLLKFLPVWVTPYMIIDAIENRADSD